MARGRLPDSRWVRIGTGAVVGAGSVVTKDIDDYAIAMGVPARAVGSRKPAQARSFLTTAGASASTKGAS
jgi:serine acetyltransferase